MEAAIAVMTFLILLLNLFIYHAQRRQFLNTMERRRKSAMASAVWPPSKDSIPTGDWILVPAMQALRAMAEASLRPHEDERHCPISSPYLVYCTRSRYTPRLDPELKTLLNHLSSDEVNLLKTFVYDVDGLNHGLFNPTYKLVHSVSSWCLRTDEAIRKVALWYTDSIRDEISDIIETFGQNCEDQGPREMFIRAQVKAYIAQDYAGNIDVFLSHREMDVAVIHLAHHVNCKMISKAMQNIRKKVDEILDRKFKEPEQPSPSAVPLSATSSPAVLSPGTNCPPLETESEKLESEKLGSEKLGSEKLQSVAPSCDV